MTKRSEAKYKIDRRLGIQINEVRCAGRQTSLQVLLSYHYLEPCIVRGVFNGVPGVVPLGDAGDGSDQIPHFVGRCGEANRPG